MKKIITIMIIIICMIPNIQVMAQEPIDDICYIEPHNKVTLITKANTPYWTYNIYHKNKWKIYKRNDNFEYEKLRAKYPVVSGDTIKLKKVIVKKTKNNTRKISFSFTNLPKDTKYKVYIADNQQFKHKRIKSFKKNNKIFTFKNIQVGKPYYIKIKCIDNYGYYKTNTKLFIVEG